MVVNKKRGMRVTVLGGDLRSYTDISKVPYLYFMDRRSPHDRSKKPPSTTPFTHLTLAGTESPEIKNRKDSMRPSRRADLYGKYLPVSGCALGGGGGEATASKQGLSANIITRVTFVRGICGASLNAIDGVFVLICSSSSSRRPLPTCSAGE